MPSASRGKNAVGVNHKNNIKVKKNKEQDLGIILMKDRTSQVELSWDELS